MEIKILNHQQTVQKLKRIALEIIENNINHTFIHIIGTKPRGFFLAKIIFEEIKLYTTNCNLCEIDYLQFQNFENKSFNFEIKENSTIILVDDVLNSGKTLMELLYGLFKSNASKIETAVLVNRNHRCYPIKANYVGLSLATTLQETVVFDIQNNNECNTYLK